MTTLISRKSMLATAVLGALFWLGVRAFAADASTCNRHCLLEILTTYTEALTDNDTSRLHVSPNVRVTGNGVVTPLSPACWITTRCPGVRSASASSWEPSPSTHRP